MSDPVNVSDRDQVRWIELCRPESRNALTVETNRVLIAALEGAAAAGARTVVLAGAGGHFCSGLDLKDAIRTGPRPPAEVERDMRAYFHGLIRAVRAVPAPVVAAVDGVAVGYGCDLALACDLRLVTERARFGEIFVRRGLMPDGGGTFTLPRLVGLGRALELMFTGDLVEGGEAVRIGLASRLLPTEGFEQAVREHAVRLAKGPPLVLRAIKRAVYESLAGDLDAALEREAAGQLQLLTSADFVEGVAAFLQKREPVFRGK
ncbi:MAG TPA: enoyl-CoA hydratase-related protein [Candidatus Acidoferrum sp.]|nr:enoyl-CoA hydratase-related protein [Candidatus Acidoferrum sp.]